MEPQLVAVGKGRSNPFHLTGIIPVGCCGDGAIVRGKSNQDRIGSIFLANQLADIQLAALAHLGGTSVTEM